MRPLPLLSIALFLLTLSAFESPAADLPSARLLVSNPAPYVGEELILSLEIRTSLRPSGSITPIWPQLDNCTVTELPPSPPRLDEGGRPALVQTVRRAIRPLRSGAIPLLASGISMNGRTWTAPPLELRVTPLPSQGRPDDFAGAIGRISISLSEGGRGDREILLTLRGDAPLNAFPTPLADPGSGERLILLDDTTSGPPDGERTRVLRYLYLPGAGDRGRLSFRLPVFNPETRSYEVLTTGVRHLPEWTRIPLPFAILGCLVIVAIVLLLRTPPPQDLAAALSAVLGRSPTGLSRRQILLSIRSRGGDAKILAALERCWADEDRQRFSPPGTPSNPDFSRREFKRLLRRLHRLALRRLPAPPRPWANGR